MRIKVVSSDGRSVPALSLGESATLGELATAAGIVSLSQVTLVAGGKKIAVGNPQATLVSLGIANGTLIRVGRAPRMVRYAVPADNSCLFAAVGHLLSCSSSQLRSVVAEAVLADPERWTEAILGRTPREYVAFVKDPKRWGGSIELTVLSEHFKTQLIAVDVVNLSAHPHPHTVCDDSWSKTAFLLWDGIHYDAAVKEDDTRTFACTGADYEYALEGTMEIAREMNKAKQYTDVAGFSVSCLTCGQGLTGQDDCVRHAEETGHTNFGQVR